jgi:hypothetical protein
LETETFINRASLCASLPKNDAAASFFGRDAIEHGELLATGAFDLLALFWLFALFAACG